MKAYLSFKKVLFPSLFISLLSSGVMASLGKSEVFNGEVELDERQEVMKELMDDWNGGSSHIDGPNCWNTALVLSGLKTGLRFTHPQEWLDNLNLHCQEVLVPKFGDVGRIYHSKDGEVHGFIHIDDQTIFAKHGESTLHGHQYMSYEKMLDQYGRTRQCRIDDDFSPECFHELKYYRCGSNSLSQAEILVDQIDQDLEIFLFSTETKWKYKSNCESENFQTRVEILERIKSKLILFKERNYFLDSAIYEALKRQFYNIRTSMRHFRCHDRTYRDRSIREVQSLLKEINVEK